MLFYSPLLLLLGGGGEVVTVKERAEIERKINGRIVSAFSFTDNLGAELNEGRRRVCTSAPLWSFTLAALDIRTWQLVVIIITDKRKKENKQKQTYLNSGFAQADPLGQIFTDKRVRIVRPLEDLLQRRQLGAGERRPIATRLFAAATRRHARHRVMWMVTMVVGHQRG